jgi:hypothetical protein
MDQGSGFGVYMIVFDLTCSNGHTFEGWFEDWAAYEKQKKRGLISCPVCDDKNVEKNISTFGIKASSAEQRAVSDERRALMQLTREISEFVEKNFDNVGSNFAKEALKIHYGASEPRNIRGVSTREEEKVLEKEGVQFFKVPSPVKPDAESDT